VTDIDTRLLRSFLSVAAEGSFSRAAERLGCSQGTMSLRIGTLEDLLGAELFERGYHRVVLSVAGQALLPQAQALVDSHDALVDRMRLGKISGTVRLGVAEDYAQPFLPGLLRRVRQAFPGIELAITGALSVRLSQQVEARNLDLAIVTLPRGQRRTTVIGEPELLWVAAEGFRAEPGQPWPIAFYPEGCAFRAAAIEALERAAVPFRAALTSSSGQVIQGAVGSGTTITIMADGTVPAGFRRLGADSGLPALPRTCIQIIERDGGLTLAAQQVREIVLSLL